MRKIVIPLVTCSLIATAGLSFAGITRRVNVSSEGDQANGPSAFARQGISADGRYVVFQSSATNLVPGDTNGYPDVFRHDLLTGVTILVSVGPLGKQANGSCSQASISADGQHVVFESTADNLVPDDSNGVADIFVHSVETGETTRVSVSSKGYEAESACQRASISGDGRYVVFESEAANLVLGDTNDVRDIFLRDRVTGTTTLVSRNSTGELGNGASFVSAISADGTCVAFISDADNLVPGDTNRVRDDFVRDLRTGTTTRVNVRSDGTQSDTFGHVPSISSNGRYVTFDSYDDKLVPDDNDSSCDVFVHDRATGETTLISRAWDGSDRGSGESPSISLDGRYVVFRSESAWLVPGDTNHKTDIFVHDREIGTTRRISLSDDGDESNGHSMNSSVGADGHTVAFGSFADNLVPGDTNETNDIFVRNDTCPEPLSAAYGEGWPGSLGVPAIFVTDPPLICAPLVLVLGNSRGEPTTMFLLLGSHDASAETPWDGTLLVEPSVMLPFALPATGLVLRYLIPCDAAICGTDTYLQTLQLDPGASAGVAFSKGLMLSPGT